MATTEEFKNGGASSYTTTIEYIKATDLKLKIDGTLQTYVTSGPTSGQYTISGSTITLGAAAAAGTGNVHIYRETNVDSPAAAFAAGSSIRAADLNAIHEMARFGIQENQSQVIQTHDLQDLSVTSAKFADNSVTSAKIADASITTAKIASDAITNAKIADNSIDSEHYVDGSIDTAHIGDSQITSVKIADGTIVSGDLANNSVITDKLNNLAVTTAKVANNAITSAKIADGSIGTGDIANDAITSAKIADDQINSEHFVDQSIDTAHIGNLQVTTAKIAADAIDGSKIADDSIDSEHYVDGSIDTAHIADSQITSAKIASNAVTTDKIQDGELTTLAGMQSGTASRLADSNPLTATTAELNQLDGITLETSVTTNSDTRIPTSKAVNDLVLSVTNALGGFVAIANETSFPTANPDPSNNAGTVVSISQLASGLAVNSSGVATISNGAGSGNTVTITGFPSSLVSQTLPATSGLQVQTTSTLHTYTFHKQLASAADIQAISATVNSFSNRYRVSASAPTSSLDGGDLWYDTTNSKLMVYSSQNSAWEESSAIGNFFISTISTSLNTGGGSATANGTAYRFTISDAPVSAQQLIVSVDGVIQKPNAGSSQPSEGFVLVGNDIIFGSAPVDGASMFVTVIGSTVGIGTPSDNTVTTAILQNGSVTTAKIVDANVTTAKITDANVTTAKIADDAVTADKIANSVNSAIAANTAKTTNATHTGDVTGATSLTIASGAVTTAKIADDAVTADKLANTSVTAASYGSSTSIPSITVDAQGRITAASGNSVNTDLVGDSSPQLGGNLDVNTKNILFGDSASSSDDRLKFGAGSDLEIYHGSDSNIIDSTGKNFFILHNSESAITSLANGPVNLYNNNVKRLQTTSSGIKVVQDVVMDVAGDTAIRWANNGTNKWSIFNNSSGNTLNIFDNNGSKTSAKFITNGAVELFHTDNKKFETTSGGATVTGTLSAKHTASGTTYPLFLQNRTNADSRVGIQMIATGSDISDGQFAAIEARGPQTGNTKHQLYFKTCVSGGTPTDRFYIDSDGHVLPAANNTYDLGDASSRWRNIYTNDLNLSNEGLSNDVDGTWGNWTIQEGESDLFLKNNRSGKKYKFNLTEVS